MNIQLQDIKLYLVRSKERVTVKVTQAEQLLFNLESTAEHSPIKILLDKIQNNVPLRVCVNEMDVELPLQFLEEGQPYKLSLETEQLTQEVIKKDDSWCLSFKVRYIMPQLTTANNQSTISSINDSQLRHKLLDLGKGTSQFQSSSSLRHSIPEVSFSQAARFDKNTTLQTEFNYKVQQSFGSSGRAASFGYGNKYITPLYVQRNAEQNPGPDVYFQEDFSKLNSVRKSIWPQQERFKDSQNFILPGPAQYDVDKLAGSDKPQITIGQRIKPVATFQESVPGPNTYTLRQAITEPGRFNKISLGYGNKMSFNKNDNTPGPGTYEQPSIFKSSSNSILNNGCLKASIMKK